MILRYLLHLKMGCYQNLICKPNLNCADEGRLKLYFNWIRNAWLTRLIEEIVFAFFIDFQSFHVRKHQPPINFSKEKEESIVIHVQKCLGAQVSEVT